MKPKRHFFEEHILGVDARNIFKDLKSTGDLEKDYGFCDDCLVKVTMIRGCITIELA